VKIDRIFIDGFGHFHDADIAANGPLTVISGANEAGKSTLLAFVCTVLFGFPSRLANRFYPPFAGGSHGGRLTLTDGAGQQYTVQRHQGPRGGPLDVTGPNGARFDASVMPSLVGPSADLFRSVFAFSLDELQDMKSLSGEEVSGRIYSAGVGAANLPAAVRELDASRQAIFAPRGRSHQAAAILNELQDTESQLAETADQATEYGRLTTRGQQVREELESIATRRAELSSQASDLDRLSRAWDEWTPIRLREDRLKALPEFEQFPENAVVRLEGLDERIDEAAPEVENAQAALTQAEIEASKEVPDEDLAPEAMVIESIRRGRDRFDSSVYDLPKRVADLGADSEKLTHDLRDLGTEWDESRLENFDASMVVRDEAEQLRERLTAAEQAVRDRNIRLERAQQDERDAIQAHREVQAAFDGTDRPALDSEQLQDQRRRLRAARTSHAELIAARQRKEDLEDQLAAFDTADDGKAEESRLPLAPVLLVVGGLIALGIGIVIEGQQATLALGAVLVVSGIAAYIMRMMKRSDDPGSREGALRAQHREAASSEQSADEGLQNAGEALGLAEIDSESLDDFEEGLGGIQEDIRRYQEAAGALGESERMVERQAARKAEAQELLDAATTSSESALNGWRTWLSARDLAETLTPNTFMQLLGRVETARAQLTPVVQMRDRIKAIERDISEYRDLVDDVAQRHGLDLDGADSSKVSMAADDLIRRLDQANEAVLARQNAAKALEDASQRLGGTQRRLERLNIERSELIATAGAADAEDLRRRAGQHEQRQDLERQLTEEREHLQRLCLPNQPLQQLIDALEQTSSEYLSDELATVRIEIETLDAQRSELDEERGGLTTELGRLATDEASSELRARRESLVAQIKVLAAEWSKLTIAATILQRTRQKYEQERQPGVIRHAQEFFATITGDRYSRVFIPADQPSQVFVETSTGATLEPEQLSRGTREQLYLALRFGLIREFGEHSESLPVIVDEVLVNFDPGRAHRAAEAFAELSKTNQVLVFTCHPEMVELFCRVSPGAQVIDLDALP
tara:strand:- start:5747 stop:8866 length:3120 start_codon:yes stop_codon:yes gene_type:complete